MKRRIVAIVLAMVLLLSVAQASVWTTGNVNLRKGPGLNYKTVGSVKANTELEFLGEVDADERGVDWYAVEYKNKRCWISSKYARIEEEKMPSPFLYNEVDAMGWTELSGYYRRDLIESAYDLGLTEYEYVSSEVPNQYTNNIVMLAGENLAECINVEGTGYKLFGAAYGMPIEDAKAAMTDAGLVLCYDSDEVVVFEHCSDEGAYVDVDGFDSCINIRCSADGFVCGMDWSTYTG